jgi:tight adherence protein B
MSDVAKRGLVRSVLTTAALVVLALVCVSLAGAQDTRASANAIRITEVARSKFPKEAFVLSLPRRAELSPENVTVLENGQAVHDLEVSLPGTGGAATFGVVLLIDASNSMAGAPIVQATAAARTLARRLPEGVQLAIVPFNSSVDVKLPFTIERPEMTKALAQEPGLAYGTKIYDAVEVAEGLLTDSDIAVGSIVLLSDGRDVGSVAKPAATLRRAQAGKARIFAVGLESAQYTPSALRGLANATQGTYALATNPRDLSRIYAEIGDTISRDYLLTYESFASPGQRVVVAVRPEGFQDVATATYTAPALAEGALAPKSWYDRVIQSTITAIVIGALVTLLVGFGTYLLARRRNRSLELRMAHFVTMPVEEQARARQADVASELEEREGRQRHLFSIYDMRWYKRLQDDVELGRVPIPASTIVLFTALASVLAAMVAVIWFGSPLGVLAALIPPYVTYFLITRRLNRIRSEFAEQLPETLDVVASALRAGHSLVGALTVAVDGSPEPSRTEFGRAMADEQLGVPLDTSLRLVAHRMANRDVMQVSLVAQLQREAGTNAAEVLDQVSNNVRNQMELRRLIKTLTAQGRMSRWIVSVLPIFLFVAIFLLNRDYLQPLWDTAGGQVAMVLAIVMICAGSYAIKKIVEIDA